MLNASINSVNRRLGLGAALGLGLAIAAAPSAQADHRRPVPPVPVPPPVIVRPASLQSLAIQIERDSNVIARRANRLNPVNGPWVRGALQDLNAQAASARNFQIEVNRYLNAPIYARQALQRLKLDNQRARNSIVNLRQGPRMPGIMRRISINISQAGSILNRGGGRGSVSQLAIRLDRVTSNTVLSARAETYTRYQQDALQSLIRLELAADRFNQIINGHVIIRDHRRPGLRPGPRPIPGPRPGRGAIAFRQLQVSLRNAEALVPYAGFSPNVTIKFNRVQRIMSRLSQVYRPGRVVPVPPRPVPPRPLPPRRPGHGRGHRPI